MAAIVTMHFAIHGAEVEVPALKDMTVADALSETAGLGLNLDVDNRYYSGDIAAGHILSQSPAPGTVVRREWHVRVAESLGPQKVDVPDAVGVDERVASLELQRAGLEVGEIARLPYKAGAEGRVIAQDPPAHAQGIEQPSINLLVAAPDDQTPDGYVMPDFAGWPISSANAALAKVGIRTGPPALASVPIAPVGTGDMPVHPIEKPGEVLTQSPAAGSRIDENSTVHFTVVK
jgi:beta-lactam-binding protein with PASTA domain